MLRAAKDLIDYAISNRFVSPDYILHGHRQVRSTICPGGALFNEIKSWPHFGESKCTCIFIDSHDKFIMIE